MDTVTRIGNDRVKERRTNGSNKNVDSENTRVMGIVNRRKNGGGRNLKTNGKHLCVDIPNHTGYWVGGQRDNTQMDGHIETY